MGELVPDPREFVTGLHYLEQEARLGHIRYRSDLGVLQYLWLHAWKTRTSRGKPVEIGMVRHDKVRVPAIAAATLLSERAVSASLKRLAEGGWIMKEQLRYVSDTGPGWKAINEIYVLMDPTSHRDRARSRDVVGGFEKLLTDSTRPDTGQDLP